MRTPLILFLFLSVAVTVIAASPSRATPPSFLTAVKTHWEPKRERLSYELNLWIQRVLQEDYANAAHLWPAIEREVDSNFLQTARAAYLFSLWQIGLPQTFLDQWFIFLENKDYRDSAIERQLELALEKRMEKWIYTEAPRLTATQFELAQRLGQNARPNFSHLAAWSALRHAKRARIVLGTLPKNHTLRPFLVYSVILELSRTKKLKEALNLTDQEKLSLSKQFHPALVEARLRYQLGDLARAEALYQAIQKDSSFFKQARSELLWIWLRQGNSSQLRGELVSLMATARENLNPEFFVVSALSNLKLCYFDQVQKDVEGFQKLSLVLAKRIDQQESIPTALPDRKDIFIKLTEKRISRRRTELKKLEQYEIDSLEGPLPTVGLNSGWRLAKQRIFHELALSKKDLVREYKRAWSYHHERVASNVRKMRFVQVEYLNQLRRLSPQDSPVPADTLAVEETKLKERTDIKRVALLKTPESELSFPVDDVLWSDEVFHIRSIAQARCLKAMESQSE